MKSGNNKRLLRIFVFFLWGIILAWVIQAYLAEEGSSLSTVFLVLGVALIFLVLCYRIYLAMRAQRLGKQIDKAVFQYQLSHDVDAYLAQLAQCEALPDVDRTAFYDLPARDYLAILKIRVLRETGRTAECRAVLDAAMERTTNELARQSFRTEEALLQAQPEP